MSISHAGTNVGMKYILTLINIIYGYLGNDNNKGNTENTLTILNSFEPSNNR